jgi:hypothetical protein
VAERVAGVLAPLVGRVEVGGAETATAGGDEPNDDGRQLLVVRLLNDRCTLSLDSSGALLHQRGYRLASGKAPLRETLGAALLLASGWAPGTPLVDPFCGSGTLAIEGAMLARRMAPGRGRGFALEHWPDVEPAILARVRDEARERELPSAGAPIVASDRDAGAIDAARANAERAGVARYSCGAVAPVAPVHRRHAYGPIRRMACASSHGRVAQLYALAWSFALNSRVREVAPPTAAHEAAGPGARDVVKTSNRGIGDIRGGRVPRRLADCASVPRRSSR